MQFSDETSWNDVVFRTYIPSGSNSNNDRPSLTRNGLSYVWCCNVRPQDAETSDGPFLFGRRVVENPDDDKPAVKIRQDWQTGGKDAIYVDSILAAPLGGRTGLNGLYVCAGPAASP